MYLQKITIATSLLLSGTLSSLSAAVEESQPLSPAAQRATDVQQEARSLLRADDFEKAAKQYEEALELWQKALKQDPDNEKIGRLLKGCQKDYQYTVYRPIRTQQDKVQAGASEGDVCSAAARMLEVAKLYHAGFLRTGDSSFTTNRVYCLSQAGLMPIKKADQLAKQENFVEAVDLYECAIENLREATRRVDKSQFAKNIKYAEEKLAKARFAHAVQSHVVLPAFDLESMDTGRVKSSDYRGRPILLVVWAGWCGNCRSTLPRMEIVQLRAATSRLAVIGINVDRLKGWDRGAEEKAVEFVKQDLSFPNAWGTSQVLETLGRPQSVPTLIWLDAEGRLVKLVDSDRRTPKELLADLEAIEAGSDRPTVRP